MLYIVLFLHQTTTWVSSGIFLLSLYIVLFLHQTTTSERVFRARNCCISYYSYIKPQLSYIYTKTNEVVYRTIPTSNHNLWLKRLRRKIVVYRTIPTSNHNRLLKSLAMLMLYIVLFLHQTTTISSR